jgi:hypothetical protein
MNRADLKLGSALLMVLLITTIGATFIITVWRTVSMDFEAALSRVAYKKNMHKAEGLLSVGVGFGKLHYDAIMQSKSSQIILLSSSLDDCQGEIIVQPIDKESIHIAARMVASGKCVSAVNCTLICTFDEHENKKFEVSAWNINESVGKS